MSGGDPVARAASEGDRLPVVASEGPPAGDVRATPAVGRMAWLSHRPASIDPRRAHAIATARFRALTTKLPRLAGWREPVPRGTSRDGPPAPCGWSSLHSSRRRSLALLVATPAPLDAFQERRRARAPRPLPGPRAHVDRSHQVPGPALCEESRGPAPKRLPSCHDRPGCPGRRSHQVPSSRMPLERASHHRTPARRRSVRQHARGAPSAKKRCVGPTSASFHVFVYEHPRLIGPRCGEHLAAHLLHDRWPASADRSPHGACTQEGAAGPLTPPSFAALSRLRRAPRDRRTSKNEDRRCLVHRAGALAPRRPLERPARAWAGTAALPPRCRSSSPPRGIASDAARARRGPFGTPTLRSPSAREPPIAVRHARGGRVSLDRGLAR
jgi:hypothetical protein